MTAFVDYYAALGLRPFASVDDVELAFRRRVMELRPDVNLDERTRQAFSLLQEARATLRDPVSRFTYDATYRLEQQQALVDVFRTELRRISSDVRRYGGR